MTQQLTHPVEELLPAYVAGSLGTADAQAVDAHVVDCDVCRAALQEWALVHAASHLLAGATPAPSRGVLDRAFAKIDASARRPGWRERWTPRALHGRVFQRSLAGVATVVALVFAVAFTPLGSYAQGLFQVMRPQQFAVVPVSIADLEALPDLNRYGDFSQTTGGKPQLRADAAEASAAMGMSVLIPDYLPPSVSAPAKYITVPSQSATFTFSAARAQAAAQAQGDTLPPMPANIDGSSVRMTTGDAIVTVYGSDAFLGELAGRPPEAPTAEAGVLSGLDRLVPQLAVMQARVPVATVTGASAEDLEQYLLSQPGISDDLADAIRAIGDPTTTWPIPVPIGEVNTRSVTVQGVRGTAFSEPSGLGVGVMWVKDGFVYAVAAPLSEREVLRVASSLR
jgi:hypothetical protein